MMRVGERQAEARSRLAQKMPVLATTILPLLC